MYQIIFYTDKNGKSEVFDYIKNLRNKKNNKDAKIKLNKIIAYINQLSKHGLSIGEPYIKHLEGVIIMNKKDLTWDEVKEKLKLSPEEEAEIQLEEDIIEATIQARKSNNLSQRQLSKKTGIKQPAIARIECRSSSPQITTLIKLLYPMGYTIRVVPLDKKQKSVKKQ